MPVGMAQVERDRPLAAVEGLEVGRVALPLERRHVARAVAAHPGVLDLDHVGAQVGEHLGAEGAGAELRDREDAATVERRAAHLRTGAPPRPTWPRPPSPPGTRGDRCGPPASRYLGLRSLR